MEPAHTIISKLGGPSVVARRVGVHRTRVSNWSRPREKGGTDGLIPQRHHWPLLNLAKEFGVELEAEDFLPANEEAAA